MYNQLFGINNLALTCLAVLGLKLEDIERFRDAIFVKDNEDEYHIEVLTRTGGENRHNYKNLKLINNGCFYNDFDDPYDKTYAHFLFKIPYIYKFFIDWDKVSREQSRNSLNLKEMFEKEFAEMNIEGTEANKRAQRAAKNLEKMLSKGSQNQSKIKIITTDDLFDDGGSNDVK